jgi:predicted nuclease of predicted toxin-antitoxin system
MRFLLDRCVGRRVAEYLRAGGHDVVESRTLGSDPGDRALLAAATADQRVLITLDKDFGQFIFLERVRHAGIIRLPDVPVAQRIALVSDALSRFPEGIPSQTVVTLQIGRVRITQSPA